MANRQQAQKIVEDISKNNSAHYEKADTVLLSMQPSDADKPPRKTFTKQEWSYLRNHLESNITSLRMWRQSWWTQNWSMCAQYILPRRSIWLTQSTGGIASPNNMTRGKPINDSIVDPTPTYAARICAAGMMSGMASPSRPWFKIVIPVRGFEPDDEAKEWLDEVEDRLYTILANSNFYNSFAQECEDLVVYGTAPSIMYEDEKDVIRLYNPAVGEYYLSSSATLRIDGLSRQFVMTIKQLVDFFGIDNCPPEVQKLWSAKGSSLEIERIVCHTIEPNFELKGCPRIPGNFAYRETYWIYGSSSEYPLSARGFVECPFSAPRWSTQSNDAYGRSVGMDVVPDAIQLQFETKRKAEGIEKGLRPPLLADAKMKNQPSSILPGNITYVENLATGTGMRSIYDVKFDLQAVTADIFQIQQRIKIGFFNDLFLMLSENPTQKQTAYEVAQKVQEKLQVLGPVIENVISESLKPKLKRLFSIATRKGLLPEMPESLKGLPLDVEFISMLVLAQKASNTGGLERIVALIGNMTAVYPEVKEVLDADKFVREFNELLDNPNSILRSKEEVDQIVQQQRQQQAMAQQMAAAQSMSQTAHTGAQAAQVLADTQIGAGQSVLDQMLNG